MGIVRSVAQPRGNPGRMPGKADQLPLALVAAYVFSRDADRRMPDNASESMNPRLFRIVRRMRTAAERPFRALRRPVRAEPSSGLAPCRVVWLSRSSDTPRQLVTTERPERNQPNSRDHPGAASQSSRLPR